MDVTIDYVKLYQLLIIMYNSGYEAGHHDTVESGFVPIHSSDITSYHADIVDGLFQDYASSIYKGPVQYDEIR